MLWAFLRIFRRGTHRGAGSESLPTETPNTLAQTNPVIEICSCNNGADHTFYLPRIHLFQDGFMRDEVLA